jgi:DNA-binding NarL/FixJ family response regulator
MSEQDNEPIHPVRVAIIEDDALLSSLLTTWLNAKPNWTVVGSAISGDEGIALCEREKPTMVLLDLELPGINGIVIAEQLMERLPGIKILVITCHADPYWIHQITRLGLHGYVNKTNSLESLDKAMLHITAGGTVYGEEFSQAVRRLASPDAFHKILTPKELAVLAKVTIGWTDQQIAEELEISHHTVATHRRNIRVKLDAHGDRDLIRYAEEWGLRGIQ